MKNCLTYNEFVNEFVNESIVIPTVDDILKIIKDEKGDVCQIGLALGSEYTKTEKDYEEFWKITQDTFDIKKMEGKSKGKLYSLKSNIEKEFAEILRKNLILYSKGKFKYNEEPVEW